ncbi:MAG: DUF47 family protein [Bacteroidales bacterium]|jgi:predicted phosphate transport protein (TIGR00153 family)|nr:DUF47 family protein [Bacteroidales bacterium]
MNNSFFARFMPKEPKFVALLTQMAKISAESSVLMIDVVKHASNHEKAIEYAKQIKANETLGDKTLIRIFDELNTTFITPFDREDIHALANRIDDVMDYLNSCAKKIVIYRPNQLPERAAEMALLVNKAASIILKAVEGLDKLKKNVKTIKAYCNELHDIENSADEVYEKFLSNLFANEKDSIEIIKLKGIVHELEKATNAAENVGKIIKTIIIKYA